MLRRFLRLALVLGSTVLGAFVLTADSHGQNQGDTPRQDVGPTTLDPQVEYIREIAALFSGGQYEAVPTRTEEFFAKYPLTAETFPVLLFEAESYYRLGQTDNAIHSYQRTVPFIEKLHNVLQRRYVWVFFRLGSLSRRKVQYDTAIRFIEAGLTREPQNTYYQIFLGELFKERGDPDRALKHFKELLTWPSLTAEERVVLKLKIDRLIPTEAVTPVQRIDMTNEPLYSGFSFGILPLNELDPVVSLHDICVLLESTWLVRCEVLGPLQLDETGILDKQRGQYDGDRILAELSRRYPLDTRSHRFIVAVAGRDIFGPATNYVFSWQNPRERVGVLSAYRFLAELDDFYERPIIATRRLGIQFISTTGSLLGFTRPTKPDCPMAYPQDFREFLLKRSKLCDSTIQQRDELLRRRGGTAAQFGTKRNEEINRVNRTYHFE